MSDQVTLRIYRGGEEEGHGPLGDLRAEGGEGDVLMSGKDQVCMDFVAQDDQVALQFHPASERALFRDGDAGEPLLDLEAERFPGFKKRDEGDENDSSDWLDGSGGN